MSGLIVSVTVSLSAALIAWLGLNFVGKDIVAFRSLRREIREALDGADETFRRMPDRPDMDEVHYDINYDLLTLSNRIRSLVETSNVFVKWYFRLNHFDLQSAASNLNSLSSYQPTVLWKRLESRFKLEKALKFPHKTSAEKIEMLRISRGR